MKIYVIIEANAYDGFELPHNDEFYLTEEEANEVCNKLNKNSGNRKDYFDVHELNQASK